MNKWYFTRVASAKQSHKTLTCKRWTFKHEYCNGLLPFLHWLHMLRKSVAFLLMFLFYMKHWHMLISFDKLNRKQNVKWLIRQQEFNCKWQCLQYIRPWTEMAKSRRQTRNSSLREILRNWNTALWHQVYFMLLSWKVTHYRIIEENEK